jgi:hypothetical protein
MPFLTSQNPQVKEFVRKIIVATGDEHDLHGVIIPALLHLLTYSVATEKCPDCRRAIAEHLAAAAPAILAEANEFAAWVERRDSGQLKH